MTAPALGFAKRGSISVNLQEGFFKFCLIECLEYDKNSHIFSFKLKYHYEECDEVEQKCTFSSVGCKESKVNSLLISHDQLK